MEGSHEDIQIDRQTDRKIERQTDRKIERQTDRQTRQPGGRAQPNSSEAKTKVLSSNYTSKFIHFT
jgi:hypothetical protein